MDGLDLWITTKEFLVRAHRNVQQFRLGIGSPTWITVIALHFGSRQTEAGCQSLLHGIFS